MRNWKLCSGLIHSGFARRYCHTHPTAGPPVSRDTFASPRELRAEPFVDLSSCFLSSSLFPEIMVSIFSILLLLTSASSLSSTSLPELIRKELRNKSSNQETIIQLGYPIRSSRIDPSRVVQISWRPRIFVYRGFISDEECDHLISLTEKRKNEFGLGYRTALNTRLDSDLLDTKDNIVSSIEERISAWALLPQENSRAMQIQHHGVEDPKKTYNYFGNTYSMKVKEPLMATIILYLSSVMKGGEILFPHSELNDDELKSKTQSSSSSAETSNFLRPYKGNAVLFFSVHPDATPDRNSFHVRHPVVEGDMWYITKFFHLRALGDENEVSTLSVLNGDSYGCTDEDDSCPRWAALGECEKNPVFMVGSPDYYGTCRKSCGVC